MSYEIVKGDLAPAMSISLVDLDGAAYNASAATSVQLRWEKPDGTIALVTLTAVDATLGKYQRVWSAGDTDIVGVHLGQAVVTVGGVPRSFPRDGSRFIWWVNPKIE